MKNKLIIIGCGGHARAVSDVVLFNNPDAEIIFLDEKAKPDELLLGFPVVKEYNVTSEKVFVAIGDNEKRKSLCQKYYDNLTSVVSKNAYIGKDVHIGKGVFIAHCVHVGILSNIEDFCILNTSCSIDHECIIKENAFIAPNSTICGKVTIGENSFIGAGATVINNITIGKNIIVGAGSVVVKDLDKQAVYAGNPVKIIKELN